MSQKFIIPGTRDSEFRSRARGSVSGGAERETVTDLLSHVRVVDAFDLSRLARSGSGKPLEFVANDDDILEIEVEDGFTLWTSADRYSAELKLLKPEAVQPDGSVRIDTLPRTSVSERGVREWFQSALRILRLDKDGFSDIPTDPLAWPADFLKEAGLQYLTRSAAWAASKLVIWKIERQLRPRPGLYNWEDATRSYAKSDPEPLQASFADFDIETPILVFVHGTGSNTLGSFGAFLGEDAKSHWERLRAFFGEHIYAFEHRTMSESPIDNAVQLSLALPRRAKLYLVSHSRGGMVGDLLSLNSVSRQDISRFKRELPNLEDADRHDREGLQKLAKLLEQKCLRIERFVRCAAPLRGTLLASDNLDTFLSVLTNLLGFLPALAGSPIYEVVKRITLQVVKNRTSPELIPGIEAMIPTSPLVALLNDAQRKAGGILGVVAGDIQGSGWLQRLGIFLTDHAIYEARDNDLVVNTDSMFSGPARTGSYYVFDQGSDVSHFNYFRNSRTRAALLDFLAGDPNRVPNVFSPIGEEEKFEPVPMLRSMAPRAATAQPTVLVLPGMMGSHLEARKTRMWLDYLALQRDGLRKLANAGAKQVVPASLLGACYRRLCDYLQSSHDVVPFAYDWRKSTLDSARSLAVEVEKALDRRAQPVRILAHGMGGLVVRALIVQRPDLWDRICERDGGRIVMLGTPNHGSYEAVEMLLGTSTAVQQLALLGPGRSPREIASIFARFPGVLELLPNEDKFFRPATWKRLAGQCATSAMPGREALARAKSAAKNLAKALAPHRLKHLDRVFYVAGWSPRTVKNIEFIDRRIVLEVTTEGDGRVTYESGKLPGVRTWYMDAAHGDLAGHEESFHAILDLLEHGTTARLPTAPPTTGGESGKIYRAPPKRVLYPTETSLTAELMGQKPAKRYRRRTKSGFRVSVVHGDLRYARFPVVVGHYEGDTIIGAEAQIDRALDGALSERYALGLYPGEFGSVSIMLRKPTLLQRDLGLPRGAVVAGLGKWGELSVAQLAEIFRRTALQYILRVVDGESELEEPESTAAKAGLSVLLIGGNSASNIATGDSVGAILRGIAQANRELGLRARELRQIAEVEIVELYSETAIEAAHALKRLAGLIGKELAVAIEAAPLLRRGRDGRSRILPLSNSRAWRRWEISAVRSAEIRRKRTQPDVPASAQENVTEGAEAPPPSAAKESLVEDPAGKTGPLREIRFLTLSDRARAEATSQDFQPQLVERLIKDSIGQTQFRNNEARLFFNLMIPPALKDGFAQLDNVAFVVDEDTAPYPWELMSLGEEPACVTKGLVRQLQTARYRQRIGARSGASAYVVGDPAVPPPYRDLPGAREEAQLVARLLRSRFDVTVLPAQAHATDVLAGLFAKPYRVVHLAGHGQYESPEASGANARSGMVLDNGLFLTAAEVGQMSQVPELVFLNCCNIGQTGPESQGLASSVEFNRLAASVSRELIEMGVRAVVAAGWAVRDDIARIFAATFYEEMLGGATFGDALKEARKAAWAQDHKCNTCGAYQAYGDPDYRLDPSASLEAGTMKEHVDPAEFVESVSRARRAATDPVAQARALADLGELEKACPAEWLALTEVRTAIGLAYGDFGRFETAAQHLTAALDGDDAENRATFQSVEQLVNYEVRAAEAKIISAKDETVRKHALEQAAMALGRLKGLLAVARTSERYSLIGSTYKRLADLQETRNEVRRNLELAAENYRCAHELASQRGGFDPYPVLNWLSASALLGTMPSDAEDLLKSSEAAARKRFGANQKFFDAVAIPDVALIRALSRGVLARVPDSLDTIDRLCGLYRETFRVALPSAREKDSVLNHIERTASLAEKLGGRKGSALTTATALRSLREALREQASQSAQTMKP